MNNIILQEKLISIQTNGDFEGSLTLTNDELIFKCKNNSKENHTELVRRVVQVGFRSRFRMFFPYKFYIRSMSGRMYAYKTTNAKKWSDSIEKLIY